MDQADPGETLGPTGNLYWLDVPGDSIRLALKTNLLFASAGALNGGVEYRFGVPGLWEGERRFSATLDMAFTRWRTDNDMALQTAQIGVGVKYWFDRKRSPLTGWNAGVYAVFGGPWDVQWNGGWQGNSFFSTGLSGGWAVAASRRVNIEFVLAAGVFHTPEARHYTPDGGVLMWRQTRRNVTRFSITKAQVNLVWLIGDKWLTGDKNR